MRHTISVLVQNEAGVLTKISGLFSGRGYNIESLTVAPTLDNEFSRFTIVATGDDKIIEQISKQLNRLINVLKVVDVTTANIAEREMVLVKFSAKADKSVILKTSELFNAKIIEFSKKHCTIEMIGDEQTVCSFIEMVKPLGIKELVRSGKVAISLE